MLSLQQYRLSNEQAIGAQILAVEVRQSQRGHEPVSTQ